MRQRIHRYLGLALFAVTQLGAEVRTLTILHTNDLHARLSPLENHHGGFAHLAAVIRHEREGCVDCIVLNAGDLAQGTPVSTIYKGLPIFEVANMLGFDAATLGNHDFDYGWQQARNFVEMAKYPIVTSNVVDGNGELLTTNPWVILKVNGLRVGVLGAMTNNLGILTTPTLLGQWHTTPLVETVRRYAAELREQCDVVVLVAHLIPEEERAMMAVPGIPVIVSGHLHTELNPALSNPNHVLVRVKGYGEQLGRLELKVDTETKSVTSWNWKKILVESDVVKPEPDVAAVVKMWEEKVAAVVDHPLATSNRAFTRQEVKLLLEEAMRAAAAADFSYMNQGGVRDILPKGQLLVRHVWNIMPFDNRVVVGTFRGKDLPAVVTAGKQVDPEKEYKFAVSDFTAVNQEANENLRTKGLKFPGDVGLLRDALLDLIRKRGVME